MPTLTLYDAVGAALLEEMRRDQRVVAFGEGIATKRHDLVTEFGALRVRNTPLSEGIIAGTAVGAAATGLRPVIDLLFAPFLCYAMDELVNSAGKLRYLSGGQFSFPLVTLAMTGAGWGVGAQHNHNIEAWFVHSPGLKVVMPSNPADAKSLLKASIRDDNPVLFFLDTGLLHRPGEVPDTEVTVPLGKATVVREGGCHIGLLRQDRSSLPGRGRRSGHQGICAEVVDLRTLKPLDTATVIASAEKTGRLVMVHEANRLCGIGAEIAAVVAEEAFASLKAPIVRLGGPDSPVASSYPLEQAFVPQGASITAAAERLVSIEDRPDCQPQPSPMLEATCVHD